ncbi:MAG TPA: peptidoglycan-binding protein, partial [Candidatus Limnocylindria bacterium]|nr:peptidoglycan-binding protein [Candidatus Limnocylindria bacterium]
MRSPTILGATARRVMRTGGLVQQVYRRGDTGPVVAEICSRLVTLGMLDPEDATCEVFDDRVDRAVRHFQQARSANVDG